MKTNHYIKYFLGFALLSAGLISCGKMDATYADLIKGGEITYTGKADSVKAYSGKNRIKLTWLLISDPKIVKCKVYWNDRTDSAEIPVQRSNSIDTINVVLNNLPEGLYSFDILSYDIKGNSSVKVTKSAFIYGVNYASGLLGREISTATYVKTPTSAVLTWFDPKVGDAGTEIKYKDKAGANKLVIVPPTVKGAGTTVLSNFTQGSSIQYRTGYVPEPSAIDTFYTDYQTMIIK